jgi:RNA polymerase sigma-70 factor (ECF subfamily)
MIERDDSILVRQCLEGDRRSFEELVRKYVKPIFNLALRMVSDSENAADIAQTTFIKAYENLRTFDLKLKFFSWLYRIAINEALNFLEKQRPSEELSEEIASGDPTPDEAIGEAERDEIIQQALMRLTPDLRSVIILRHFTGLTYAEMSSALSIPERKVKSRLFSARRRLRELLLNKGL